MKTQEPLIPTWLYKMIAFMEAAIFDCQCYQIQNCEGDCETLYYSLFYHDFYFAVYCNVPSVCSTRGRIQYTDMYNMLRNMEPPVGFGKKCPYRLAYRVRHKFCTLLKANYNIFELAPMMISFKRRIYPMITASLQ